MESIKVKDVMFYDPFMIKPTQSVAEAAILMKDIDCGALPVGEPDRIVGIITDRDITLRVTAEKKDPSSTLVKDAMTKTLHTCDEETSIEDAAKLMQRHNVCRMVVTKGRKASGIVTLKHLLKNTGDAKSSSHILHSLLAPQAPPARLGSRRHG